MTFDKMIERRGTHSSKWDKMEQLFGVPQEDGLSMWTADSDFATAPCVQDAVRRAADLGVFGYSWEHPEYLNAVSWWMKTRHNWDVDPEWVLTSQGLGNAIALCLDIWSNPGDGILIFTPVYHEFALKVKKTGRKVVECPLARDGDNYVLDLDDAQSRLTGDEKMILFCSPQNPSGRVWTPEELRAVAEFAERNDLMLVSDEIHHDLVYAEHTHVPTAVAAPEAEKRLVTLTAASKTFNIAGMRTGNMIIADPDLRAAMRKRLSTLDYGPASLGVDMITAAYSPDGAEWVDAQLLHLVKNRAIFDAGINAIPGLKSMPLQSTYLAWVDFTGTGMDHDDVIARIRDTAKIAVSPGPAFGTGGEGFQRFNLATQGARVEDAVARMQRAFADLQ
ncbi:MalY/PatB family protein [Aliiroseovarius lamellibrachiae]|uniref:MalY/PatB family protein n=1 Tax=Aliiroseovarius lamellibrachiae TaxID=1924933 RepID=UPI001BDFE489|nr:MalY/PatB family protein [Aliiroseovarius lamellibrachiae]MBT2131414.1 pyridoxal phosphate-dependent aminotransferase [Aliiroseovarius lamellibrachiae]